MQRTLVMRYVLPSTLGLALLAGAAALIFTTNSQAASHTPKPPMVLDVNPNGGVLLRGTVESVGSSSLVVKSWGGNWTIKVSSSTEIHPKTTGNSLSGIEVGDFVGVLGQVSISETLTINARLVRDWTEKREAKEDKKEGRLFVGTASTVGSSTLTLSSNTTLYTVYTTSTTKILNRNWLNISFSDIKVSDKIRVWGKLRGTSTTDINAEVVRDISLP